MVMNKAANQHGELFYIIELVTTACSSAGCSQLRSSVWEILGVRVVLIKKASRSLLKKKAKGIGGKTTMSKWLVASSSSVEMEKICKGFVPKNMQKATKWAVRVFEEWRAERNKVLSDNGELCPSKVLVGVPFTDVTQLLAVARFIVEAHRVDGQLYPPSSILNLFKMSLAIGQTHCNFMSGHH